MIDNFIQLG